MSFPYRTPTFKGPPTGEDPNTSSARFRSPLNSQLTSYDESGMFRRGDREVYPELSEPNEFPTTPLPGPSRHNMKSGPHFVNRKINDGTELRWTPYGRPTRQKQNLNMQFSKGREPYVNYVNELEGTPAYIDTSSKERHMNHSIPTSQGLFPVPSERTASFNRSNFSIGPTKTNNKSSVASPKKKIPVTTGSNIRHLTGSVDHVVRWHRMVKSPEVTIYYEASGTLENMINKDCKQLLFLRGMSGHVLQGVFYTIDRRLPHFSLGSVITATGRMVGGNKLHVFDAYESSEEEQAAAERLWFLCQHSLENLSKN